MIITHLFGKVKIQILIIKLINIFITLKVPL